ncbi:hypothetical protein PVK06_039208 [Gossypium arboreum]|uniref:Transmembrane protein n=1 Tax=Gossypium arboreum TaxID=29729 RepID=A0ABR0N2W4_GOSAR|nr:hypothetical protein PVK06_039208 [Gossypium arboreum]
MVSPSRLGVNRSNNLLAAAAFLLLFPFPFPKLKSLAHHHLHRPVVRRPIHLLASSSAQQLLHFCFFICSLGSRSSCLSASSFAVFFKVSFIFFSFTAAVFLTVIFLMKILKENR